MVKNKVIIDFRFMHKRSCTRAGVTAVSTMLIIPCSNLYQDCENFLPHLLQRKCQKRNSVNINSLEGFFFMLLCNLILQPC